MKRELLIVKQAITIPSVLGVVLRWRLLPRLLLTRSLPPLPSSQTMLEEAPIPPMGPVAVEGAAEGAQRVPVAA